MVMYHPILAHSLQGSRGWAAQAWPGRGYDESPLGSAEALGPAQQVVPVRAWAGGAGR